MANMHAPRRIELAAGGASGLIAGLLVGSVQLTQNMMSAGVIGTGGQAPGIGLALVLGLVGGLAIGAGLRYRPDRLTGAVTAGVLAGLLWWTVQWLTVVPLLTGHRVTWSLTDAEADFGYLIGNMVYGGLTAALMQLAVARWSRAHPNLGDATEAAPDILRIVVVGGGFAGVSAAQGLEHRLARRAGLEITLVSNSNFLLFTPMLAGVAGGTLHAQDIGAPVRSACPQTDVQRGTLESIDPAKRLILVRGANGESRFLTYDHLVLALGAVANYRGLPGVAEHCLPLKTLQDAVRLRDHVISQLEQADAEADAAERRRQLTFAVAGGGFAGAELIAELCDLVRDVLRYYPRIEPRELRFVLIHSQDRILPELAAGLADFALSRLRAKGIEFILSSVVASATAEAVVLGDGRTVQTRTAVWTAGNEPNPVVKQFGLDLARGAIACRPTLQVKDHDDIWALGDCAAIPDPDAAGAYYPPTAQHALREGHAVAANIATMIRGGVPAPFRFRTIALIVALGHQQGAAQIRGHLIEGRVAWLMWRGVYLSKLPGMEKKVRVAMGWILDMFFPRDVVLSESALTGEPPGDPGRHQAPARPSDSVQVTS